MYHKEWNDQNGLFHCISRKQAKLNFTIDKIEGFGDGSGYLDYNYVTDYTK